MKTILYADRDRDIRELVTEMMDEAVPDFHVEMAETLQEAGRILTSREIDGIVLDGMFLKEALFSFIADVRREKGERSLIILVPKVDFNLDPDFIRALTDLNLQVAAKSDVFRSNDKMLELFKACLER